MREPKRRTWIAWASIVLFVAVLAYPLSYPAVFRARQVVSCHIPESLAVSLSRTEDVFFTTPLLAIYPRAPDWAKNYYDAYFHWWTGRSLSDLIPFLEFEAG